MRVFFVFNRAAASGKPTNAASTNRASRRLARPGMVLDSCRNVFAPESFAAKTGGALVNPPIASTAAGERRWKSFCAAPKECQKLLAKEK